VGRSPNGLGPNLGDPLLNVYFLEWGAHQISLGLPDPWNAPFFHPTSRVLTLSDHLLGPASAFLGLRTMRRSARGSYNVLLAAPVCRGGWMAFWFLRKSGLSPVGALVGGWSFAFSSFRWSQVGHYPVLRMQWIPAVLWTFDRLLDRATPGRAAAFVCFYALHVTGGAYLALLIHFPLAVLLLNRWRPRRGRFLTGARLAVWAPTAAGRSPRRLLRLTRERRVAFARHRRRADAGATRPFATPPQPSSRFFRSFPRVGPLPCSRDAGLSRRRASGVKGGSPFPNRDGGVSRPGAVAAGLAVSRPVLADRFTDRRGRPPPAPLPGDSRDGYLALAPAAGTAAIVVGRRRGAAAGEP
jgi:hypothetical protein